MNLPGSDDLSNIYAVIESESLFRALASRGQAREDLDYFLNLEKPLLLKKYLNHLERGLLSRDFDLSQKNQQWFDIGYNLSVEMNGLEETQKDIIDFINRYFTNDSFLWESEVSKILSYGDSLGCNFKEKVQRNKLSSECIQYKEKDDIVEMEINLIKLMKLETNSLKKYGLTLLFEDDFVNLHKMKNPMLNGSEMNFKICISLYQKSLAKYHHFLGKEVPEKTDKQMDARAAWDEKHYKLKNEVVSLARKCEDSIEDYKKKIMNDYLSPFKTNQIDLKMIFNSSLSEKGDGESVVYRNFKASLKVTVKKELAYLVSQAILLRVLNPMEAVDKIDILMNDYLMKRDLKNMENNGITNNPVLLDIKMRKF